MSTDGQGTKRRRKIAQKFQPPAWLGRMSVTDRHTTGELATAYSERERASMQ